MDTAAAIANAVRLLENAESETNLQLMDALIRLAEIWIQTATLIDQTT